MDSNKVIQPHPERFRTYITALHELGPAQLISFGIYQLGLRSGHYRRVTRPPDPKVVSKLALHPKRLLPAIERERLRSILGNTEITRLLAAADEVIAGRYSLFGGDSEPLVLCPPSPLRHWTEYLLRPEDDHSIDIKIIWEPARFGWAILLGRAYAVSSDERYAAAFWENLEAFFDANPPYLGQNWISGQEAALRLLALTFCWNIFADSDHSTSARSERLALAISQHAERIPPTLIYARAQNNNHLLSEAAGLFTAGLALPGHPSAARWKETGFRWFQRGLQMQISTDGTYIQHSTSYQRLMLQLGLWMETLAAQNGCPLSPQSRDLLAGAARWLLKVLDQKSGQVPNLGPNDGANILPLSNLPIEDYRPVLQASAAAFLNGPVFEAGLWDEMPLWLGYSPKIHSQEKRPQYIAAAAEKNCTPHVFHSKDGNSWAYLRAARFNGRPGHADQLHVDLWWKGMNIASDAGTYLYNGSPPWDNALAGSDVHNTVLVDGYDQMQRAGRFLYINQAQAQLLENKDNTQDDGRLVVQHDGYRKLGLVHRRSLTALPSGWLVEDEILPARSITDAGRHTACLHWLLPDWSWDVEKKDRMVVIGISAPEGRIELLLSQRGEFSLEEDLLIIRSGELVFGQGLVKPIWGWKSRTYNEKQPGLSVRFHQEGDCPLFFRSEWKLG